MTKKSAYPAIVLARLSSSRLPEKALKTVKGKPLINYVFETLQRCPAISNIVLATSNDTSDDRLADHATKEGINVFRGSLENPAERFCLAMNSLSAEAAFRVNGDSPLINASLFEYASQIFSDRQIDLVTNVHPRTYPPGVSVELIRKSIYNDTIEKFNSDYYREHVTSFFYKNSELFKIHNLVSSTDFGPVSLAVDTADDLSNFRKIIDQMSSHHSQYSVEEIIAFLEGATND